MLVRVLVRCNDCEDAGRADLFEIKAVHMRWDMHANFTVECGVLTDDKCSNRCQSEQ